MSDRDVLVFVGACGCIVAAQVIPAASPADRGRFVAEHAEWGDPQVWTSSQVREGRVWCGRCRPPGNPNRPLGPRACTVCPGGRSLPCIACASISEHAHLEHTDRHDQPLKVRGGGLAQVPLCRSCASAVRVGGVAGRRTLSDVLRGSGRAARERADA